MLDTWLLFCDNTYIFSLNTISFSCRKNICVPKILLLAGEVEYIDFDKQAKNELPSHSCASFWRWSHRKHLLLCSGVFALARIMCSWARYRVSLTFLPIMQTFDWKMFVQNFRSLAFNGKWIVSFCCQIDTVLNHLGEGNVIEKLSIFFGRVLLIANLCEGDKSG